MHNCRGEFFREPGSQGRKRLRLGVMDMWKPFEKSMRKNAPQAATLCDKFHVLLGEALDQERRSEYAYHEGADRRFIKGQRCTLLSSREHLTSDGRNILIDEVMMGVQADSERAPGPGAEKGILIN